MTNEHQKKKQVLHQKRKTDKTSLPPRARKHKPYTREKNHTPKRKKKNHTTHSRLTSQHHPATPADTDPHPIPPTYFLPTSLPSPIPTPYPHTVHTPTDTLLPSPDHILPAATSSPPVSLLYAATLPPPACTLSATVPMPVSVSLPLALNLCSAPCRSLRHPPPPAIYHAHLYRYHPDCCLHTVHMSVCTIVLTLSCHHAATLGSGPVLTTGHRPHLLCVTPVTCATTSPLRESTLTPCRFHHPYRSLTLAHRVVPPLVVPVPSLAVSGVRLSLVVPLAGESPLADARLRLTPMVTCCSLTLAHTLPSIHALSLPAPPCTHTCSHSFQHSC